MPTFIDSAGLPSAVTEGAELRIIHPGREDEVYIVTRVNTAAGVAILAKLEELPHPGHCGCMGGTDG